MFVRTGKRVESRIGHRAPRANRFDHGSTKVDPWIPHGGGRIQGERKGEKGF
jgi:hypothetical protein